MIAVIRWTAVVLAAIAFPLTLTGIYADRSLDNPRNYVAAMSDAWDDPALRAEVSESILDFDTADFDTLLEDNLGPWAAFIPISDDYLDGLQAELQEAVDSPAFRQAWLRWHWNLHQDMAAHARGEQPQSLVIDSDSMTFDVGPLIEPLVTEAVGGIAGAFLSGPEIPIEVELEEDLGQQLRTLGTLADWRWVAGVATLLFAGLAVWLWPSRLRGLGVVMVAMAAATLGLTALSAFGSSEGPSAQETSTPLLVEATGEAFATSTTTLIFAAAITGLIGAVLLAYSRAAQPSATA